MSEITLLLWLQAIECSERDTRNFSDVKKEEATASNDVTASSYLGVSDREKEKDWK